MEIINAIKERRSINFFDKNKELDSNTINNFLELANLTPSSFNLQPWEVLVVKSKAAKQKLKALAFNQPKVEEASINLVIVANPNAVEENIETVLNSMVSKGYIKEDQKQNLRPMPFNLYSDKSSVQRKLFAVKNAAFFAMSVMLAAKGLGLDTHPMDGFDEAGIKKEFKISEEKIVPVIIAVGYPAKDLKLLPRNFRRELKEFVTEV